MLKKKFFFFGTLVWFFWHVSYVCHTSVGNRHMSDTAIRLLLEVLVLHTSFEYFWIIFLFVCLNLMISLMLSNWKGTISSLILFFWFIAKGEEYHAFREGARQQWDSVKCYFQKVSAYFVFSFDFNYLFSKPVWFGVQMSLSIW